MKAVYHLARAAYRVLWPLAAKRRCISYTDLCAALPTPWRGLSPRSELLADALGEIVRRCRAAGLPALPALVVHASGDRQPGAGYFRVAHPETADPDSAEARIAWSQELAAVYRTKFPASLDL